VYGAKVGIFNKMLYVRKCTCDEKPSIFIRDNPIFWSERMLHKDYYRKGSAGKKKFWSWFSRGWRQDELIGGKPPVVK
jgi:hypothetical protein